MLICLPLGIRLTDADKEFVFHHPYFRRENLKCLEQYKKRLIKPEKITYETKTNVGQNRVCAQKSVLARANSNCAFISTGLAFVVFVVNDVNLRSSVSSDVCQDIIQLLIRLAS